MLPRGRVRVCRVLDADFTERNVTVSVGRTVGCLSNIRHYPRDGRRDALGEGVAWNRPQSRHINSPSPASHQLCSQTLQP
jgi:hypothetical protein